jgi:hypothetical protein
METKFKIGNLVYCITQIDRGFWCILSCEQIKRILIDNGVIRYGFIDSLGKIIYFRESDCFLIKQEARDECKKRNIELQKQQDAFTKRIEFLVKAFRSQKNAIKMSFIEKENYQEISEQLEYELKGKFFTIIWTK